MVSGSITAATLNVNSITFPYSGASLSYYTLSANVVVSGGINLVNTQLTVDGIIQPKKGKEDTFSHFSIER